MKTGWMTVGMLAVAAAILAASPGMRDVAVSMQDFWTLSRWHIGSGWYSDDRIAAEHPNDAKIALAQAESGSSGMPWDARKAANLYTRAMALDPQSSAVPFELGLFWMTRRSMNLADRVGSGTLERYVIAKQAPSEERRGELDKAIEAFRASERLDPENSACDYFSAMAAFSERRDTAGDAYLRAAIRKDGFDLYDREVTEAQAELLSHKPDERALRWLASLAGSFAVRKWGSLREFGRYLMVRAEEASARGDSGGAMLPREALVRLGHVIRTNPYRLIDGLSGEALTAMAAEGLVTKEEAGKAKAIRDSAEGRRAMGQARAAALARWAASVGRPDLGATYAEDLAADEVSRKRVMALMPRVDQLLLDPWESGALNGLAVAPTIRGMVALGVLVGLLWLVARPWRKRRLRVGAGACAGLLVLALLPGQVAATAMALWVRGLPLSDATKVDMPPTRLLVCMGVVSVVLWVVGAVVVALRARRKVEEAERPGTAMACLQAVGQLIGPTVAAVVLLAVLGLLPVEKGYKRLDDQYKQMVMVGEVRYWGLDGGGGKVPGEH